MPICDACGKYVKDLRKHRARGRCGAKSKKGRSAPIEQREPWLR